MLTLIASTAALSVTLFFGNLGAYVGEALVNRFISSGSGLGDISVAARFREYADILAAIKENPLIGHGMGATFTYYNILERITEQSLYAHNAFLFLIFKVGIIGAALFFAYFFLIMKTSFVLSRRKVGSMFDVAINRAILVVLLGLLMIATNSGVMVDKEALFLISLCAGLTMSMVPSTEQIPERMPVSRGGVGSS